MTFNPLMSQIIVGLPGLWDSGLVASAGLDLSAFINFADLSLIESAVQQIATKSQQDVLNSVASGDWYDFVDNFNTLGDSGLPVTSGAIRTLRSVTSNQEMAAQGALTASRLADQIRFGRDHYLAPLQISPNMTIVLIGDQLRTTRTEYICAGGNVIFALSIRNPRYRIAFHDGRRWKVSSGTGYVASNNKHMLTWRVADGQVSFYFDGQLSNSEPIQAIAPQLVSAASWFGLSRSNQSNFDGYGLFVYGQPVDIDHIHCFAAAYYGIAI